MTKKDAYYFSHDSNARNDLKMVKLRRKEGLAGIGLFWCVIEMLRESKGYELPTEDIEDICYELRCEEKSFETLFICELLIKEDDVFYSISLKDRLLKMDEKKERRKLAGSKGGKAKAMLQQKSSNATKKPSNALANPSKETKEDKTKEDKIRADKKPPIFDSMLPDFLQKSVEFKSLFSDFLEMRKKIKAVNSDRAIKGLYRVLENESGQNINKAIAIVNQSVMNSWKGLFPYKGNFEEVVKNETTGVTTREMQEAGNEYFKSLGIE